MKKITGNPALDAVIGQINKTFKKDNMITLGPSREPVRVIPTGSTSLDIDLGHGGIPVGRVTEIYGPEGSGKTSLALSIASQYQKIKKDLDQEDRFILVVDLEHTLTHSFMESMGVDPTRVVFCRPDSAEEAFQSILDMVRTNGIGFVLLDSVDAAQSQAQLNKNIGELTMGGIGKIMGDFLRQFIKLSEKNQTTSVFINQIRAGMNPYGPQQVTPGGYALKFYTSCRMALKKPKPDPNTANSMVMGVKIIKNKIAGPCPNDTEFGFVYGKGPEIGTDLLEACKRKGVIRFGGSSVIFKPAEGDEYTIAKGGQAGFAELIRSDPAIQKMIRERCFVEDISVTISSKSNATVTTKNK